MAVITIGISHAGASLKFKETIWQLTTGRIEVRKEKSHGLVKNLSVSLVHLILEPKKSCLTIHSNRLLQIHFCHNFGFLGFLFAIHRWISLKVSLKVISQLLINIQMKRTLCSNEGKGAYYGLKPLLRVDISNGKHDNINVWLDILNGAPNNALPKTNTSCFVKAVDLQIH